MDVTDVEAVVVDDDEDEEKETAEGDNADVVSAAAVNVDVMVCGANAPVRWPLDSENDGRDAAKGYGTVERGGEGEDW